MSAASRRRPAYGQRRVLETLPQDIPGLVFGDVMGSGHFSHVYRGTYQDAPVAIKVIERGNEDLIQNEIEILTELSGLPHIVRLIKVIRVPQFMLIFEMIESVDSDTFMEEVQLDDLRVILRCLLIALDGAHRKDIVHRDVKLGNVLVSPDYTSAVLLDWGCAAWISESMGSRAGSRSCRPPEMLLGYRNYGAKCDIWAFGILILCVFTDGAMPWRSRENDDVLRKLVHFFDREKIEALAARLQLSVPDFGDVPMTADKVLEDEFADEFMELAVPPLIDLMMRCLTIDPYDRPSAAELLAHPFFEAASK
jgi:serine/threonine protein kinase